ncbi:hypothetical protein U1Q18_022395, partial [Sarracenia purpurea var. burkii]
MFKNEITMIGSTKKEAINDDWFWFDGGAKEDRGGWWISRCDGSGGSHRFEIESEIGIRSD